MNPETYANRALNLLDDIATFDGENSFQFIVAENPGDLRILKKQHALVKKQIRGIKSEISAIKKNIRAESSVQRQMVGKSVTDGFIYGLLGRRYAGAINTGRRINMANATAELIAPWDAVAAFLDQIIMLMDGAILISEKTVAG